MTRRYYDITISKVPDFDEGDSVLSNLLRKYARKKGLLHEFEKDDVYYYIVIRDYKLQELIRARAER